MIEDDKPPLKALVIFLSLITVFIIAVAISAKEGLWFVTSDREYDVDLSQPNREISELKATFHQELTTYDVVDDKKGFYRIPIDQAMEALAQQGPVR